MLIIPEQVKQLETPNGQTVGDVIAQIGDNSPIEPQINELIGTMDYLLERLIHCDSSRF